MIYIHSQTPKPMHKHSTNQWNKLQQATLKYERYFTGTQCKLAPDHTQGNPNTFSNQAGTGVAVHTGVGNDFIRMQQ